MLISLKYTPIRTKFTQMVKTFKFWRVVLRIKYKQSLDAFLVISGIIKLDVRISAEIDYSYQHFGYTDITKNPHPMIVNTKERNLTLVLLDIVLKIKITVARNTVW